MPDATDPVRQYLAAHPHHHETTERWPIQGAMHVRLSLATRLPPAHVSSSILAIVLNASEAVLFLWPSKPSGSIAHLLIGGRPEGAETPEQTIVREVSEETGWVVQPIQMIGFRHFFQLEPRSDKTDRPYPDFIQPIFAARAVRFAPELVVPSDRIPAEFIGFVGAQSMIDVAQQPLLHAAADSVLERGASTG